MVKVSIFLALMFAGCSSGKWIEPLFPFPCPTSSATNQELQIIMASCMQQGLKSKDKIRCENGKAQVLCE